MPGVPIAVFGGKSVGGAGFKYHENRESHIFARDRAAATAARAVLRRLERLIPGRKLTLMHYVHCTLYFSVYSGSMQYFTN